MKLLHRLDHQIITKLESLEYWQKTFTVTIKSPIYLKRSATKQEVGKP